MTITAYPINCPVAQWFDNNGDPLDGGLLYSYAAGTTTQLATYLDATGTANTNPVVADSAGRMTVYLGAASYKLKLAASDGSILWTADNIISQGLSGSNLSSVFAFAGDPNCPITATSYPSGTTFSQCHAGSGWYSQDSANLVGTYALQGMLQANNGATVTAGLFNLTDLTPDTPLVVIASTSSTGERQISGAVTFPAAGATKVYAIKVKVDTQSGFAWDLALTRLT